MSNTSNNDDAVAARRLRELFKGRFDQQTALNLLKDLGGELQAVDFILNEKEEVVQQYLNHSPSHVQSLIADSKRLCETLENGIEFTKRQFACGLCQRSWWKKVSIRKEVSKCWRCKTKYDPVPKDNEWGWAKFICECGNEFHGFGEMCVTVSSCYQCGQNVPVHAVLPPQRRIGQRKARTPHSCNGINCYNRMVGPDHNIFMGQTGGIRYGRGGTLNQFVLATNSIGFPPNGSFGVPPQGPSGANSSRADSASTTTTAGIGKGTKAPGAYPNPAAQPMCCHPKSDKPSGAGQQFRTVSMKHVSSGSTVTTFLSQGSLDIRSDAVPRIPPTIPE